MTTTIKISDETRDLIASFGSQKETYEEKIIHMYELAVKEQLRTMATQKADTEFWAS